jgi:hypothetical protein
LTPLQNSKLKLRCLAMSSIIFCRPVSFSYSTTTVYAPCSIPLRWRPARGRGKLCSTAGGLHRPWTAPQLPCTGTLPPRTDLQAALCRPRSAPSTAAARPSPPLPLPGSAAPYPLPPLHGPQGARSSPLAVWEADMVVGALQTGGGDIRMNNRVASCVDSLR